jgi:hypothetical protein
VFFLKARLRAERTFRFYLGAFKVAAEAGLRLSAILRGTRSMLRATSGFEMDFSVQIEDAIRLTGTDFTSVEAARRRMKGHLGACGSLTSTN